MIPANLPKFLSIPNPICICSATLRLLSFPVQSFSVFAAFCSAAPLEKLVYILAVITAELVLPVFIQTAKNTAAAFSGPYSAAAASAAGALPPASTAPVRQFLRRQFQ